MPEFDYDRAIEIMDGVYQIGYYDEETSPTFGIFQPTKQH